MQVGQRIYLETRLPVAKDTELLAWYGPHTNSIIFGSAADTPSDVFGGESSDDFDDCDDDSDSNYEPSLEVEEGTQQQAPKRQKRTSA